jgi:hypothetical protein
VFRKTDISINMKAVTWKNEINILWYLKQFHVQGYATFAELLDQRGYVAVPAARSWPVAKYRFRLFT